MYVLHYNATYEIDSKTTVLRSMFFAGPQGIFRWAPSLFFRVPCVFVLLEEVEYGQKIPQIQKENFGEANQL